MNQFVYLTVGTGIGGGSLVGGELLHGAGHPEMGHMFVPHDLAADPFLGSCPFHGDCLEGLASGGALSGRWGKPAHELPAGHPAWELEAHYLALALANIVVTLAPERIILGGGVMRQPSLLPRIRAEVQQLTRDYPRLPRVWEHPERFFVAPGLGERSGVLGAIALAQRAAQLAE